MRYNISNKNLNTFLIIGAVLFGLLLGFNIHSTKMPRDVSVAREALAVSKNLIRINNNLTNLIQNCNCNNSNSTCVRKDDVCEPVGTFNNPCQNPLAVEFEKSRLQKNINQLTVLTKLAESTTEEDSNAYPNQVFKESDKLLSIARKNYEEVDKCTNSNACEPECQPKFSGEVCGDVGITRRQVPVELNFEFGMRMQEIKITPVKISKMGLELPESIKTPDLPKVSKIEVKTPDLIIDSFEVEAKALANASVTGSAIEIEEDDLGLEPVEVKDVEVPSPNLPSFSLTCEEKTNNNVSECSSPENMETEIEDEGISEFNEVSENCKNLFTKEDSIFYQDGSDHGTMAITEMKGAPHTDDFIEVALVEEEREDKEAPEFGMKGEITIPSSINQSDEISVKLENDNQNIICDTSFTASDYLDSKEAASNLADKINSCNNVNASAHNDTVTVSADEVFKFASVSNNIEAAIIELCFANTTIASSSVEEFTSEAIKRNKTLELYDKMDCPDFIMKEVTTENTEEDLSEEEIDELLENDDPLQDSDDSFALSFLSSSSEKKIGLDTKVEQGDPTSSSLYIEDEIINKVPEGCYSPEEVIDTIHQRCEELYGSDFMSSSSVPEKCKIKEEDVDFSSKKEIESEGKSCGGNTISNSPNQPWCNDSIPSVPKIELPDFPGYAVRLPDFKLMPLINIQLPDFIIEELKTPDIELCNLNKCQDIVPDVDFSPELPNIKVPIISMPQINTPNAKIKVNIPEVDGGGTAYINVSLPHVKATDFEGPNVNISSFKAPGLDNLFSLAKPEFEAPTINFKTPKFYYDFKGPDMDISEGLVIGTLLNAFGVDVPDLNFSACLDLSSILPIPLEYVYEDYVFSWPALPEIPEIPYCNNINDFCGKATYELDEFKGKINEIEKQIESTGETALTDSFDQMSDALEREIENKMADEINKIEQSIAEEITINKDQYKELKAEGKIKIPSQRINLPNITIDEIALEDIVEQEGINYPNELEIPWERLDPDFKEMVLSDPIEYDIPNIPLDELSWGKEVSINIPGLQELDFKANITTGSNAGCEAHAPTGNPCDKGEIGGQIDDIKEIKSNLEDL